jgi:hypothetical protein
MPLKSAAVVNAAGMPAACSVLDRSWADRAVNRGMARVTVAGRTLSRTAASPLVRTVSTATGTITLKASLPPR